jgi:hypothetical protein
MKNLLKWLSVLVVILYAGWIAFPVLSTYIFKTDEAPVPQMAQDDTDFQSRLGPPITAIDDPGMQMQSIQGDTAVAAMQTHNIPVICLWAGVIIFYIIAAFLQANNNIRAALAYIFAFVADLVLTYLTKGEAGSGIYDKVLDILSNWDPRYVLTLVAMVMAFSVFMAAHPSGRKRFKTAE